MTVIYVAVMLTGCGGGGDAPTPIPLPVSNAGTMQNVTVGTPVTLDGSESTAPNNGSLTYNWTLATTPNGSTAALSNATAVKPKFVADMEGTYVAALIVNDGSVNSKASTVTINATVGNAAPVANAGVAQNVITGSPVTLNGSASTDAENDQLSYNWTLTSVPAGSAAVLTGATTVNPTFVADSTGVYVATLVVRDGQANSTAATVVITAAVGNAAPIANAGAPQSVTAGALVTLNGSGSTDANSGDTLSYSWTLTSKPAGSTAALSGANTAYPTFTANSVGTYVATLVVNDGKVSSAAVTVTISATVLNLAPIANAGPAQNAYVGNWAHLNGGGSSDPNAGDTIHYKWTLTTKPAGSSVALTPFTAGLATPNFYIDRAGVYVFTLVVDDGSLSSAAATVQINAAYVLQGGLAWMPTGSDRDWAEANAICNSTVTNGQMGWRLPTQSELLSLHASGAVSDKWGYFYNYTWSSSYYVAGSEYYIGVNLYDGDFYDQYILSYLYSVCVHSSVGL